MKNSLNHSYEILNLQLAVIEVKKNHGIICCCGLKLLALRELLTAMRIEGKKAPKTEGCCQKRQHNFSHFWSWCNHSMSTAFIYGCCILMNNLVELQRNTLKMENKRARR